MKDTIRQLIQQALANLTTAGVLPTGLSPAIQVENTKDKTHGDFASNIAMMLAKPAGMKPRDLAEKIIAALPADENVSKAEIAGPGFLNFFQNSDALAQRLHDEFDIKTLHLRLQPTVQQRAHRRGGQRQPSRADRHLLQHDHRPGRHRSAADHSVAEREARQLRLGRHRPRRGAVRYVPDLPRRVA